MGTRNLGLTQYPNATGNTILANWNSDAEKIDNAINNGTGSKILYRDYLYINAFNNGVDNLTVISTMKCVSHTFTSNIAYYQYDKHESTTLYDGLYYKLNFDVNYDLSSAFIESNGSNSLFIVGASSNSLTLFCIKRSNGVKAEYNITYYN